METFDVDAALWLSRFHRDLDVFINDFQLLTTKRERKRCASIARKWVKGYNMNTDVAVKIAEAIESGN